MALHNQFGKQAEDLAVQFFKELGYEVLFRNWRHSHYEIDIIACKEGMLHFIEVKARQSAEFAYPEHNYSVKKFQSMVKAADEFLFQHPGYIQVQYDILSITLVKQQPPEYFLIEDISPP